VESAQLPRHAPVVRPVANHVRSVPARAVGAQHAAAAVHLDERGRGSGYERLFACLSDGNRLWAHTAPVLILATALRERYSQATAQMVPYPHSMHDLGSR